MVATVVRRVLTSLLVRARLDERLTRDPAKPANVSKPLGDVAYFLVILLFLPAILANLGLGNLLAPLTSLIAALPRLFAAAIILVIGLFIAGLVRNLVQTLTASLDGQGARLGLSGGTSLSSLLGLIVYVLILLPVISSALAALGLPAVAGPIQNLIDRFLAAIPGVIGAALVIAVAYFVGRLVAQLVTGLLAGIGFDRLPSTLGFKPAAGAASPSRIVGTLVMVVIILLAVQAALPLLHFDALSSLLAQFLVVGGQVLAGLVVFVVGIYLSSLAAQLVLSSGGPQSRLLSTVACVATLAVAFALAFGLGGREAAGKVAEGWREQMQNKP